MSGELGLVLAAFALGMVIKLAEECLRREYLAVALHEPLNREDSKLLEEVAANGSIWYNIYVSVLLIVAPRKALRRVRREIAEVRASRGR